MKRQKKKLSRRPSMLPRPSDSAEFLEALVPLMVSAGHSPKRLLAEFKLICGRMKEPAREWDPADLAYVADLPHVLSHWYTDAEYLDSEGAPRPLRLRSSGPSLTALIKRVYPDAQPAPVVQALVSARAVREQAGLYEPFAHRVLYLEKTYAHQHALLSVFELLRTVTRNCAGGRRGPPLLHQTAINSWVPERYLPELHKRLKRQAGEILWEFDRFMRRRESTRKKSEPVRRVGLGIYAIEERAGPPVRWTQPRVAPSKARSKP
jgi:hypothetical protein